MSISAQDLNQSLNNLKTRYFQTDQHLTVTSDVQNSITDSERLYGMGRNVIQEGQPLGSSQEHLINLGPTLAPDSPNEGDLWNDSELKTLLFYSNSMAQSVSSVLFANPQVFTVSNTNTKVDLIGNTDGYVIIPANFLGTGKILRITALGFFNDNSMGASATMRTEINGTTQNTQIAVSGPTSTGTLQYNCTITTESIGIAGLIDKYDAVVDGSFLFDTENIDTTIDHHLHITWQMDIADPTVELFLMSLIIEALN